MSDGTVNIVTLINDTVAPISGLFDLFVEANSDQGEPPVKLMGWDVDVQLTPSGACVTFDSITTPDNYVFAPQTLGAGNAIKLSDDQVQARDHLSF